MGKAVQAVLNANQAVWSGLPAFVTAAGDLDTQISTIEATRAKQETATTGFTENKRQVKADLIRKLLHIGHATAAYAQTTGDSVLLEKVRYTKTDYERARDMILKDMAQVVYDEASAVSVNLVDYGVQAGDLADLQNLIADYTAVVESPRQAIAERKTATNDLTDQVKEMMNILKGRLDMLMENFKASNPGFYSDYFNARIIVDN